MNGEKKLTVTEVALRLNCSVFTINNWYAFKRLNPEHKMAKLLPDYEKDGERGTRYWKLSDMTQLRRFKRSIVIGRNGFLGVATQRYSKKNKENKNANKPE